MSRIIKWLAFTFLWSALSAAGAHGKTITATTCLQTDVASAVASAQTGDTVVIPTCTQTNWGDNLTAGLGNLTISKCINIQGSGQSATILGDNVLKNGTDQSGLFLFNVSCGNNVFTLHDLTIIGVAPDTNVFNKGHIRILGSGNAGFRVYNVTGTNMVTAFATGNWNGPGLFDHLTFPNCGGAHGEINWKASSFGGASYGDGSWSDPNPIAGTNNGMIFVEDSTWTCSGAAPSQVTDGDAGERMVFRFNTVTDGNNTNHGADSSGRERSGRWQEDNNKYTFTSNETPAWVLQIRGGSGVMWGNSISAPGGLNRRTNFQNYRDATSYSPWGKCDGTSVYDQNTSGQTGYRCVDQPGSGQSNVISGNPPSPAAWVGNALEPAYVFRNTGTTPTFSPTGSTHVAGDRDYYTDEQGSQGVRSGTFSTIPSTCNVGQGYWATDQGFWNNKTPGVAGGQLYKCTSANTWKLWYTPYSYPHPLQLGSGTPPAPPTALADIVN
jgi:hypothetical protein